MVLFFVFFWISRRASHVRWIRLSWIFIHRLWFWLFSGAAIIISNLSVIVRTLQPPSPHLNARRYFGRMLSCRQFVYFPAWEYCGGFSFSCEFIRQARLLFLEFRFHVFLPCTSRLLDRIMGLVVNCPNPLHPILTRNVTLGECCHAANSYTSQLGNIVMGFYVFIWIIDEPFILWTSFSWLVLMQRRLPD